jgi:inner membrane protein
VGPRSVLLLCVLSIAPDLDVLTFALDIPYIHPLGHRGLTHSVAFAALLALPFGIYAQSGQRSARVRIHWWLLAFAVVVSHGVLDAITDGGRGVGFWIPFDDTRHFLPWRPLPVSPIGVGAFLSERGVRILLMEAVWIWLPAASIAAAMLYIRRKPCAPARRPA